MARPGRRCAAYAATAASLIFWAAVVVLGVLDGFSFLSHTSWKLEAPAGSAKFPKVLKTFGNLVTPAGVVKIFRAQVKRPMLAMCRRALPGSRKSC